MSSLLVSSGSRRRCGDGRLHVEGAVDGDVRERRRRPSRGRPPAPRRPYRGHTSRWRIGRRRSRRSPTSMRGQIPPAARRRALIPTAASGPSLWTVNVKVNGPPPVPGSGDTLPLTDRSADGVAATADIVGAGTAARKRGTDTGRRPTRVRRESDRPAVGRPAVDIDVLTPSVPPMRVSAGGGRISGGAPYGFLPERRAPVGSAPPWTGHPT